MRFRAWSAWLRQGLVSDMTPAEMSRDQLIGELEALTSEFGKAQDLMRERERLYHLMVENSPGLMCTHDLNGVLLAVNPAAARSLGYAPEENIGTNLREYLAPSVRHLFDDYLARIRDQGSDSGFLRLVARDGGEQVWMYRNLRHDSATIGPHVLSYALDVTERIQAQQALEQAHAELAARIAERTAELNRTNEQLRASEARYRALSEHAYDLVAVLRADATISYVSPSLERILGYRPSDLLGRLVFDLVHDDDRAQAIASFDEGIVEPGAITSAPLVLRVRDANDDWRVLEVTANNLLHVPEVGGIIVNAHDITQRRLVEQERAELLRKEQEARTLAESAVKARDEFLTAAAHDLRTPMTVIIGHVDMIRSDLTRGRTMDDERLLWRLDSVARAGSRLLTTIDEITDASLLQIGQPIPLRLEQIDVGAMVREVASIAESIQQVGASSITVDAADGVIVMGDQVRLERVLFNIIGNAVKYSHTTTPVVASVRGQDGWAIVTVRDAGVGIPADEIPKIFTHFYRASTAGSVPGMGIGLAGAKAIVEHHGGHIAVESVVGAGTTVVVSLPPRPE